MTLSYTLSFLLNIHLHSPLSESNTISAFPIGDSDWYSQRKFYIARLFNECLIIISSVLLSISYSNYLIVYIPELLLIIIILVRRCVCFRLMQSVFSLLAFFLLIPLSYVSLIISRVDRENSRYERNPTSYCNSLILISAIFLIPAPVRSLCRTRIKASNNTLLQ